MNNNHNNMLADQYFLKKMENIFVDRGVYKVVETFSEYISHRYRNNCYEYSSTAIMGMNPNDYLVRGTLTISYDWMWADGGYEHGWVEFLHNGIEFVFDSRCKGVVLKKYWYNEFKPQNIVKFTKQDILNTVFVSPNMILLGDNVYQIGDTYREDDKNKIFNPFRKSKVYFVGKDVKKFVAYKEFCN